MKGKRVGLMCLLFLFVVGIGFFMDDTNVYASNYDSASDFYSAYGDNIVFHDGYFYFATRGKEASSSVNTIHWGTIGYRMKIDTKSKSTNIYFKSGGYYTETISEISSGGYVFDLYRINLSYVKYKLSNKSKTAYQEFIESGGNITVDCCMVTIRIDSNGNKIYSGSMDENGNFAGSVYTSYEGIANAAPWSSPSSLTSYFNKTIIYQTELKSKQVVYVRYQKADGSYGDYKSVVNKDYVYGETVSWSKTATACYKAASLSYKVSGAKKSYITIYRYAYKQKVYVKYQDLNGNYASQWTLVTSKSCYYGMKFGWTDSGNACYKNEEVKEYTVKDDKNNYLYIERNKYTVSVNAGAGIASVSGSGTYYYGATCTINATVKNGYTWSKWTGYKEATTNQYRITVASKASFVANASANTYYIAFYSNGGTGTMKTMTCKYDQIYTLSPNTFANTSVSCTYIGWSTEKNSLKPMYSDRQKVKNLTSVNGKVINLYAIWDQAPELSCENRYFTLSEAKKGSITGLELLATAGSTDREDTVTEIKMKNYSSKEFMQFTSSGSATIAYITKDSAGNKVEKTVTVYIVDTDDSKEGDIDFDGTKSFTRFISRRYLEEEPNGGGLEETSIWKLNPEYSVILSEVLNKTKNEDDNWTSIVQVYSFSSEDIKAIKAKVNSIKDKIAE